MWPRDPLTANREDSPTQGSCQMGLGQQSPALAEASLAAEDALPACVRSPSSSLVKGRKVVSSFKFLLKSMHSKLSLFLMALIFCRDTALWGRSPRASALVPSPRPPSHSACSRAPRCADGDGAVPLSAKDRSKAFKQTGS